MCIILPVNHIPCTHTVFIWQHCIDATQTRIHGLQLCRNVQQHDRAILSRKPCENCGGHRFFARRGGVAERGSGSAEKDERLDDEEADDSGAYDSGYHSDNIYEEDEATDLEDTPLSPRATTPLRMWAKQRTPPCQRPSLKRNPSWKPSFNHGLGLELEDTLLDPTRRASLNTILAQFDSIKTFSSTMQVSAEEKTSLTTASSTNTGGGPRRESTLLHPSSPPAKPTLRTHQTVKGFPFPKIVQVRTPAAAHTPSHNAPTTKESVEMPQRPGMPPRKKSSLLHPSSPIRELYVAVAQCRTVLSVPPKPCPRPTCGDEDEGFAEPEPQTCTPQGYFDEFYNEDVDGEEVMLAKAARMAQASRRVWVG